MNKLFSCSHGGFGKGTAEKRLLPIIRPPLPHDCEHVMFMIVQPET